MEWLPIETERLLLRRFGVGDLSAFQSYRQDAELSRYQGWQPVPDVEAQRFLREQERAQLGARGAWLQVALTRRQDGLLIGDLGLCVRDEALGAVELGFTLARWAHKRGFASEAVSGVLAALFGLGLARSAIAVTDARNQASIVLLERTGFRQVRSVDAVFRNEVCRELTFVLTAAAHAARAQA
jgi:aminoglycoside 6'-N-acetyltransferase